MIPLERGRLRSVGKSVGFCRVDSMMSFLAPSRLWGVGRPTGGLNAELVCVLGVQSLPAAELHGLGADDASNGLTGEKPRSMLCQSVRRVPLPRGSSSHRRSLPPQLYSSSLGASARLTVVSVICGVGAPTVESFTGPTVARFVSVSKGAHARRCAGS